ncbi:MAG: acyltransferase [Opitutaceae bacterium]
MRDKPVLWSLLGGVRFFLALIVAGGHLTAFDHSSRVAWFFGNMSGLAAVLGFLAISGFSIAASSAERPKGFLERRALRIFPLYILAILFSALCTRISGGTVRATGETFTDPAWSDVWQNLIFAQGITAPSIGTNAAVWTLSIEVILYLATPLLVRLSQGALALIAMASLILFMMAPYFFTPYYTELRFGSAVALLAWAWLAGFIAFRHRDKGVAALVLLGVFVTALSVNRTYLRAHWHFTLSIVALAFGLGDRLTAPRWLHSGLSLAGGASYPLYLFHTPFYITLQGAGVTPSGWLWLVAIIALSVALDRVYDQPVKRLIKKNFLAGPLAASASAPGRSPD